MKRTVEHVKDREPIPDDTILSARVTAVKAKKKKIQGEEQDRVFFEFKVTEPGHEWQDQRITGDVPDTLNDGDFNRLRQWSETLLGYALPLGFELDTDDLVNKDCRVCVGFRTFKGEKGEDVNWNFVQDLLPAEEPF